MGRRFESRAGAARESQARRARGRMHRSSPGRARPARQSPFADPDTRDRRPDQETDPLGEPIEIPAAPAIPDDEDLPFLDDSALELLDDPGSDAEPSHDTERVVIELARRPAMESRVVRGRPARGRFSLAEISSGRPLP